MGKRLHNVFACARTSLCTCESCPDAADPIDQRHDFAHLSFAHPRVETIGLPIRMPLATAGGFSHRRDGVLFTMMPDASRATSASFR